MIDAITVPGRAEGLFEVTGAIIWCLVAAANVLMAAVYTWERVRLRVTRKGTVAFFEDVFIEREDVPAFRYAVGLIAKNAKVCDVMDAWNQKQVGPDDQ